MYEHLRTKRHTTNGMAGKEERVGKGEQTSDKTNGVNRALKGATEVRLPECEYMNYSLSSVTSLLGDLRQIKQLLCASAALSIKWDDRSLDIIGCPKD